MKAILVIDMPKNCEECRLTYIHTRKDTRHCCLTNREVEYRNDIDNCPLKPMPEKKYGRLIDADAYLKKVCTYKETGCGSCKFQIVCPADEPTINDCLDEIMGETE